MSRWQSAASGAILHQRMTGEVEEPLSLRFIVLHLEGPTDPNGQHVHHAGAGVLDEVPVVHQGADLRHVLHGRLALDLAPRDPYRTLVGSPRPMIWSSALLTTTQLRTVLLSTTSWEVVLAKK